MDPLPSPACRRVRSRLPELLDGALAPLEDARDRGHLEACGACGEEFGALERLLASLRALGRREEDADARAVRAAVLARLDPRAERARPALAALAAAAGLLALCWLGSGAGFGAAVPEPSGLAQVIERAPGWATLVRGLERLSRMGS